MRTLQTALGCTCCVLVGLSCTEQLDGRLNKEFSAKLIHDGVSWVSPADADETTRRVAALEVALLSATDFVRDAGDWVAEDTTPVGEQQLLCSGEPFATEVSLARCSGVAVASDIVVTAAHCLDNTPCEELLVTTAFDTATLNLQAAEVVRCAQVLASDEELDVAVMQLDQALLGDYSCPLRRTTVSTEEPGILVSHPLGTSTKIDLEAILAPDPVRAGAVRVAGDAFAGSSGGGVFDQQGRLVAILTRGLPDLTHDEQADCMRLVRYAGPPSERTGAPLTALRSACDVLGGDHSICKLIHASALQDAGDAAGLSDAFAPADGAANRDAAWDAAEYAAGDAAQDPNGPLAGVNDFGNVSNDAASCSFSPVKHWNTTAVEFLIAAVLLFRRRRSNS